MSKKRCVSPERGVALLLIVIALLTLVIMVALAVDLGVLYAATQQAQHTANAAALAGAGKLREGMDPAAATQEAITAAINNTVLNDPVTLATSDVKVGAWDATNKKVVAWDPTATQVAVQVTVRRTKASSNGPVPTFFAHVFGTESMETTRTAVAGLFVNTRPREAVSFMVVQDGSSSFQGAWSQAIAADTQLLTLVNGASVTGDASGMVTFNAKLSDNWLKSNRPSGSRLTYYQLYSQYPGMNTGIKYTTDTYGRPVKTTDTGVSDPNHGLVRPMVGALTSYDPSNHSALPTVLDKASRLLVAGNAWGDTDTAVGLNYAIDRLMERTGDARRVIVLVSDGKPHSVEGNAATTALENAAVAAANRAGSLGIRIHTVTLSGTNGADFLFNESLIRNGGYGLRAADASKLRDLLISVGAIEIGYPSLLQ